MVFESLFGFFLEITVTRFSLPELMYGISATHWNCAQPRQHTQKQLFMYKNLVCVLLFM